jgi:chemotaxis protein CheX
MRTEFVNPFITAAFAVFESVTGARPERGQVTLRTNTFTTQQVSILAGVSGSVAGTVVYGMSIVTAMKIASAMMNAEVAVLDDMAMSALSELGNIITGNATTLLSQSGYELDITPPSLIKGVDVEICTRPPALVVPLSTPFGRVEVNVALSEEAVRKAA